MVRRGSSETSEDEAKASGSSASEQVKEDYLRAVVFIFKQLDLDPPTGGCPNQIVLVGWSPTPDGFLLPCLHHLIFNSSNKGCLYRPLYVL